MTSVPFTINERLAPFIIALPVVSALGYNYYTTQTFNIYVKLIIKLYGTIVVPYNNIRIKT